MLFGETDAVYCEGTYKYTLWTENSVRMSQEKHDCITLPNQLMLLKEIIAVYFENRIHMYILWGKIEEFFFSLKFSGTYIFHKVLSHVFCRGEASY
jgi:hypothetical protein